MIPHVRDVSDTTDEDGYLNRYCNKYIRVIITKERLKNPWLKVRVIPRQYKQLCSMTH